jgi:hypothetical protein
MGQCLRDQLPGLLVHRVIAPIRIADVEGVDPVHRPCVGQGRDGLRTRRGRETGRLEQREGATHLPRRKCQDGIAMGRRHRQNQVGVGSDRRREASGNKTVRIATELRQHRRGRRVHGVSGQALRSGAARGQLEATLARECGRKSLGCGRSTDVPGADEQNAHARNPSAVVGSRTVHRGTRYSEPLVGGIETRS